jgi:hypothetical protein
MEKKMIKLMLPILTLCLMSIVEAGYVLTIPLEQSMGGPLPSGSINISPRPPSLPTENWQPAEPIYSEWITSGAVYGCSTYGPSESTILKAEPFTQTADCKQDMTRTKQNREQETTTLIYRNTGTPNIEINTITTSGSRNWHGTAPCSFIESGPNATFWARVENGIAQGITVNGVQIKFVSGYSVENTFTINGIKYTRGMAKITYSEGTSYSEVCK